MEEQVTSGQPANKNYVKALVLAAIFGTFGADRFYLGKKGTAVLKLLTFGGFGLWTMVDFIITLLGEAHAQGSTEPLEDADIYKNFFGKVTLWYVAMIGAFIIVEFGLIFAVGILAHGFVANSGSTTQPSVSSEATTGCGVSGVNQLASSGGINRIETDSDGSFVINLARRGAPDRELIVASTRVFDANCLEQSSAFIRKGDQVDVFHQAGSTEVAQDNISTAYVVVDRSHN